MSADAKCWPASGDNWRWEGVHDLALDERFTEVGLSELLRVLEAGVNGGKPMRWVVTEFSDGKMGLRGYCA